MTSVPSRVDGRPQDERADPACTGVPWTSHRYHTLTEIGVGAYGVVFKAQDRHSEEENKFVAMKCIRVENTEQGMPLSTVREIALLRQLESCEHPNVVRLLDICAGNHSKRETQLMLVFEYVDQDLDMFLKNTPITGLEPARIKDIMRQMLMGLDFLHSMRVVHRDMKPQNILVTKSGQVKIADFGLARIYSVDMALTEVVVTLWYRSPEVLLQDSYATPVDLWSIGCIFAELYNKRPLFRGTGDVNQLKKIFDFIGRPSEAEWPPDVAVPMDSFPPQPARPPQELVPSISDNAADFLMKLLVFDPGKRLTAETALKHNYIQRSPDEEIFLSSAVNQAVMFTSRNEGHRRLPYTKQMNPSPRPRAPDSPEPRGSGRSTITPSMENISTEDSSKTPTNEEKPRKFGDVLPVPDEGKHHEESDFLTPPSDLASPSSSGFLTSSSSRSSSPSDSGLAAGGSGALQYEIETSLCRSATPSADRIDTEDDVLRRKPHKEADDHRMSWAFEPIPDVPGVPGDSFTEPQCAERSKAPTYKVLESGKYVPYVAPQTAHSSQGSYSSSEGDSQASQPRPEK